MGNSINSFDKFIIENTLKDVKALKKSVDKSIKKFVIESRKKFTLNPKIDREFTPYITLEKSIQVDDNYDELIDGIGDGISTTTYNYKRTYVPSDVYMKGLYTVLSDYMYKGVNGIFFYIINDITGQMCSVIDIEISEKGEISGLQKSHVSLHRRWRPYFRISRFYRAQSALLKFQFLSFANVFHISCSRSWPFSFNQALAFSMVGA